jgi:hypothetical protein
LNTKIYLKKHMDLRKNNNKNNRSNGLFIKELKYKEY